MSTIAVIPARGGSKRISDKNIKDFCGKPIIAWPIEVLKKSPLVDFVVVSTDSERIAEIATAHGANVPFMRPKKLADDFAVTQDVILHALVELRRLYGRVKHILCVYPTSVFLTHDMLGKGFELMESGTCQMVMTIAEFPYPIQRALKVNSDGFLEYDRPKHKFTRSNDLSERYQDAAQFYLMDATALAETQTMFTNRVGSVKVPRKYVVDIDTPEDWEIAEAFFRLFHSKPNGVPS